MQQRPRDIDGASDVDRPARFHQKVAVLPEQDGLHPQHATCRVDHVQHHQRDDHRLRPNAVHLGNQPQEHPRVQKGVHRAEHRVRHDGRDAERRRDGASRAEHDHRSLRRHIIVKATADHADDEGVAGYEQGFRSLVERREQRIGMA